MDFNPQPIDAKWRDYWREHGTYRVTNDTDKPKYYVLDMFPYPSGSGLHVGHPLGYIASDIVARYKRMRGHNVLHPMGYDAFGLPAEQYAIQTGVHPAVSTAENTARYREQLDNIGLSFDWDRQVNTSDPQYYKWTQWIFILLFEHWYDEAADRARPVAELREHLAAHGTEGLRAAGEGGAMTAGQWNGLTAKEQSDALMSYRLAYRKSTYVNWCEALGTVLANDEVKDGRSERGNHPVERREMLQWSLRITAYAQRLLDGLETVDFSEGMVKQQGNWIGRSVGAQLFFAVEGRGERIEVFTTRPDTIYGVTFMVLAPEHDLVAGLTTPAQAREIEAYQTYAAHRSERERQAEVHEVTGAFTGAHALNPFSGKRVPVYIADYVLKDYGTGAIMAVPSDDERDQRFAEHFGLEIIDVVDKTDYPGSSLKDKEGKIVNSDFMNGLEVPAAIEAAVERIEERGIGERKINFRLRDAIYSRQRYWGEPFPIVYDADGVPHALPLEELPLELPELDDFKPAGGGKAPLARNEDWVNLPGGHMRETDTMPGFAGSSWYFLRYMDPDNPDSFVSKDAVDYWRDVDLYVGGTEHAVGHLMYSRFWHKFLYDLGYVPTQEPYRRLLNQGMIGGTILYIHLAVLATGDGKHHPVWVPSDLTEGSELTIEGLGSGRIVADDRAGTRLVPLIFGTEVNEDKDQFFRLYRDTVSGLPASEHPDAPYFSSILAQGSAFGWQTDEEGRAYLELSMEMGKMSKRKYNVVNPDDIVTRYGADCFRMYEMFLGPVEQGKPWKTSGIDGVFRALRKFWHLFYDQDGNWLVTDGEPTKDEMKTLHTAIDKIGGDIDRISLNTCVSAFMVAVNELGRADCRKQSVLEPLVRIMAPFAPHLCEELYSRLRPDAGSVHHADWPTFEPKWLVEDSITYPIAINGKTRLTVDFPADASKDELEKEALAREDVQKYLTDKTIRKVIVVPKRMINIVVG